VIVAEAAEPLPPWVEVTALVLLFCEPVAVARTLSVKAQVAPAASAAADKLTLFDPAAAVIVPPPQLPARPLGVATSRPAGRVSVKPIPVREDPALGLDRLKVRVVVSFKATCPAPKDFEIFGGRMLGGGGDPPEEHPPQANAHKRPRIAAAQSSTRSQSIPLILINRR
jgi:hypothetical protein